MLIFFFDIDGLNVFLFWIIILLLGRKQVVLLTFKVRNCSSPCLRIICLAFIICWEIKFCSYGMLFWSSTGILFYSKWCLNDPEIRQFTRNENSMYASIQEKTYFLSQKINMVLWFMWVRYCWKMWKCFYTNYILDRFNFKFFISRLFLV